MPTTSASTFPLPNRPSMPRQRIRELYPLLKLGRHPPGPLNSITDVTGVCVSTQSIRRPNVLAKDGKPASHAVNTGVTAIIPRKDWFEIGSPCGIFRFNGSGEMTGSHWIAETGLLNSPIIITNSFAVGACYDGVLKHAIRDHADEDGLAPWGLLPVISETFDGYLNDVAAMAVTPEFVVQTLDDAKPAVAVQEGNTGGGTGMMCQGFKGGTGSASRIIKATKKMPNGEGKVVAEATEYTVGAVVQANYGAQWDLKFGGVPVGRMMMDPDQRAKLEANLMPNEGIAPSGAEKGLKKDGSIIIVLATSAPLSPLQLQRLAKRATVGLARVGGWGSNSSGDLFIAFSTGYGLQRDRDASEGPYNPIVREEVEFLQDDSINALFEAAADTVEESIYNALCMAEDTEGPMGRTANAINLATLKEMLERWCPEGKY